MSSRYLRFSIKISDPNIASYHDLVWSKDPLVFNDVYVDVPTIRDWHHLHEMASPTPPAPLSSPADEDGVSQGTLEMITFTSRPHLLIHLPSPAAIRWIVAKDGTCISINDTPFPAEGYPASLPSDPAYQVRALEIELEHHKNTINLLAERIQELEQERGTL